MSSLKPFHLGFDARMYGVKHAGIGRYVENVVNALFGHPESFSQLTLFLEPQVADTITVPAWVTKVPVSIPHYTLKEQVLLPRILKQYPVDLMHFPHFNLPLTYNRPFVVTIHDILWHQFKGPHVTTLPAPLYLLKYAGYRLTVRRAVTASKAVTVPSQYVKDQIVKTFPKIPSAKIHVFYEGVASSLQKKSKSASAVDVQIPPQPYVIYVGSCYPHKNLITVLKSIKTLATSSSPLSLVIVSARDIFQTRLKQLVASMNLEDKVYFLGRLSDEKLIAVESQALSLIAPSRSEGFGLPGLEAMSLGVPVIASNAGSQPEIYGSAALYFDALKDSQLTQKINEMAKDQKLRQTLIQAGFTQSRQFSWSKTARQTIVMYHEALGKHL